MSISPFFFASAFWLFLGMVAYAYLIYPLLAWVLARNFPRSIAELMEEEELLPSISLLIAAHNEQEVIADRLRNALQLDYPQEKLEILVASDGSIDATASLVRQFEQQGVRLLDYFPRRGKAAVLNSAMKETRHDIVLLSDANTHFDAQAVRKIVRGFQDPQMGVVCGRLILTDPASGRNADGLYWKYENFLKRCEGKLGALIGANGAIYAIRKSFFQPIPDQTIVDDLVIPLLAKLKTGCAISYDCEALAWEETPGEVRAEFHRRSRIGAGGFQSIALLWPLLSPRHGWISFSFLSHKILRWLCPFFLLGMLLSNLFLMDQPFYQAILACQLGFYLTSFIASYLPRGILALKPLRLTTMFTGMNLALLVGFWKWFRGSQQAAWKRTARLAEAPSLIP